MESFCENHYLNIIVSIIPVGALNITINTTLKYCHKQALNKKLNLIKGLCKKFPKRYLAMKYLAL